MYIHTAKFFSLTFYFLYVHWWIENTGARRESIKSHMKYLIDATNDIGKGKSNSNLKD